MSDNRLKDAGVLVTRPSHQAHELAAAIESAGGRAIRFPVLEIKPVDPASVAAAKARMPAPDLVVFVSRNAVDHGIEHVGNGLIAAIGPATAAAIEKAGRHVDIRPNGGFDSEALLAADPLQSVAGQTVLIVRGTSGREYLGDTLRDRGADVHYLATYERVAAEPAPEALENIEREWRAGRINAVTVFSIETLDALIKRLPKWCATRLEDTPLVTPAARVIKETLNRFPASRPVLASGPEAAAMVTAIAAIEHTGHIE